MNLEVENKLGGKVVSKALGEACYQMLRLPSAASGGSLILVKYLSKGLTVCVRTNHRSEIHKEKLMGPYENVRAHLETLDDLLCCLNLTLHLLNLKYGYSSFWVLCIKFP
jgi:hypothetical protein